MYINKSPSRADTCTSSSVVHLCGLICRVVLSWRCCDLVRRLADGSGQSVTSLTNHWCLLAAVMRARAVAVIVWQLHRDGLIEQRSAGVNTRIVSVSVRDRYALSCVGRSAGWDHWFWIVAIAIAWLTVCIPLMTSHTHDFLVSTITDISARSNGNNQCTCQGQYDFVSFNDDLIGMNNPLNLHVRFVARGAQILNCRNPTLGVIRQFPI